MACAVMVPLPVFESNVTLYEVITIAVHVAVKVRLSAGIVAGIAASHPLKVYPSLLGFSGAVMALA